MGGRSLIGFKAPTAPMDGTPSANRTTLSLYITSLMVDLIQDNYEAHASMMAAIKCQDDRAGERGARPEWVWEFWQNNWVFRRGSEVWGEPFGNIFYAVHDIWCYRMPTSLSQLPSREYENPGNRFPCHMHPDSLSGRPFNSSAAFRVLCSKGPLGRPRSLVGQPKSVIAFLILPLCKVIYFHGLDTGDVRFICLEKYTDQDATPSMSSPSMSSSASGTSLPFSSCTTARKRVIYAHSDILVRRSEYFATMLTSSFSENTPVTIGERKVYTVVVEEADFETMYWLLKYCYANWLLFKQDDDPRTAIEGVGAACSVKWSNEQRGEWDWKTFHRGGSSEDACDNKSATSGESLTVSPTLSHSTSAKSEAAFHPNNVPPTVMSVGGSKNSPPKPVMRQGPSSSGRRTTVPSGSSSVTLSVTGGPSSIPRAKPVPSMAQPNTFSSPTHYSVSSRSSRPGGISSASDPHSHPTPAPGPASALAIYQTAHRYVMPNLAALALEHIMSTISPQSSFALLLATSLWEELHSLIEVSSTWIAVRHSCQCRT